MTFLAAFRVAFPLELRYDLGMRGSRPGQSNRSGIEREAVTHPAADAVVVVVVKVPAESGLDVDDVVAALLDELDMLGLLTQRAGSGEPGDCPSFWSPAAVPASTILH